jgi:hypothetical protein
MPERRVFVGDEGEGVADGTAVPAYDALAPVILVAPERP